jgi:hypothetical protein
MCPVSTVFPGLTLTGAFSAHSLVASCRVGYSLPCQVQCCLQPGGVHLPQSSALTDSIVLTHHNVQTVWIGSTCHQSQVTELARQSTQLTQKPRL